MLLGMIDTQAILRRWNDVGSNLDERRRRLFAACEVRAAGRGGLEAVAQITGYARSTLGRGLRQLDAEPFPTVAFGSQAGVAELWRARTLNCADFSGGILV